jgi:uncharacterized membrane protein
MATEHEQAERLFSSGVHASAVTTIQRSPEDLYHEWRTLGPLHRILDDLVMVEVLTEERSRWAVKGPAGTIFKWEAVIIKDEPGSVIAWKTVGDPDVVMAGSVRFHPQPADRGTTVRVIVEYVPPAGRVGDRIGKFIGEDAQTKIRGALHRFRQVMETGEVSVGGGSANRSNGDQHEVGGKTVAVRAESDA